MLSFKTELKLNNAQRTLLAKAAGVSRFAYNTGLAYTKKVLELKEQFPQAELINVASGMSLNKWYNHSVKSEFSWLYDSPKDAGQYALVALGEAWKACFSKKKGAPKFKKKGVNDSFSFQNLRFVGPKALQIPKIGKLRTYERLPNFTPKLTSVATISKDATGRWFISCLIPLETQVKPNLNTGVLGIDVGVKHFAVLSNREVLNVPSLIWKLKTKISSLQKRASRTVKGSRQNLKLKASIQRCFRRKRNILSNFLHQTTKSLTTQYKVLGVETLSIKGMQNLKSISPKLQEIGLFEFSRQLDYKAKLYDSEIVKADKWFPSSKTCSACGDIKQDLTLSDRVFSCACGLVLDRDLNASLNLEKNAHSSCAKGLLRESAPWFPVETSNIHKC